jgi:hypothetical protein
MKNQVIIEPAVKIVEIPVIKETAQDRWMEKNDIKTKSFKLKGELVKLFVETVKQRGDTQTGVISKFMKEYIENDIEV